jgi:sigma-B regulation protein RsbU (phosphoserine phosphatase)
MSLAVLLCAATTLFAFVWMYDARLPTHPVEIGFNQNGDTFFDPVTACIRVFDVDPGSPAEQAGLRAGDHIFALNGSTLTSDKLFDKIWSQSKPGDRVDLTVSRVDAPQPVTLHAVFRAAGSNPAGEGAARASARQAISFFPIFFLLVGFSVLFLRLDDSNAWLLALLFACFVGAPSLNTTQTLPPALVTFMGFYRAIFLGMIASVFYIFFAIFPERSPLDRRAPWLKWVAVGVGVCQALPGLVPGNPRFPQFVTNLIGELGSDNFRHVLTYGLLVLGIVSLVWNSLSEETSAESRRKSRVLLAGTLVGVCPFILGHILIDFTGYHLPFWVDMSLSLLVLLYPLSFAYAVVRHRVLEIPALLRRSARYVLVQRGFFVFLFCGALLAIFLFTQFFSRYFVNHSQFGMALSAAFGVALVWVSGPVVKRGTDRIDRAFFRSAYDARMILQDLAEKIRTVSDRRELAALLDQQLTQAFHPQSLAIYFGGASEELLATGRPVPAGLATLAGDAPYLRELRAHGRTWDVPPPDDPDAPTNFSLVSLAPECLVPLLAHDSRLVGLLVLGKPLSEEPYSREDKTLLDSVANQAAVSLENMRMAEQIADRLELDRRAERDMQIAREVQSRLFPQVKPVLASLEYAGSCIQARQVGGDYYDFLDLGSSERLERGATRPLDAAAWHLAFVLADISGKGIAGALLMANLQANLRSRYALALDDLPRLLKSVNQLFFENTPDDRYATMFFAVYDDHTRELEYANCGHNAPLLFRANGCIERLTSTSTVIGLFLDWECVTQSITLRPNDVLVIYTDGVTEANDANGAEFGESRLCEVVRANCSLPPAELLTAIQAAVQKFSPGEQFDDLTLVVARAR